MAKKQIRLNENELKSLIRESVINFLNENMDELTPGFAIHAAHAAAEDKKKHPGRGKNSSDPALRAKRDAQIKKFGDYAADAINQEIDDPDFLAIGDRGARRMMYANGDKSAYLTNDLDDVNMAKLYSDNYAEGDEPMTIGDLPDDERKRVGDVFDKFKAHHAHAKELDDKYLEEKVKSVVSRVIKESFEDGESEEYRKAREYVDKMDWYAYGCSSPEDLTWQDLDELAFDASLETGISSQVLLHAMSDCLSSMGYDID